MPFDTYDFENINEERRKSIKQSIKQVSLQEVQKMGQQLFKFADDPWRDQFFAFLKEHPAATFHHAVSTDGVNFLYCDDKDRGIWFLPGTGVGPLRDRGKRAMKDAIGTHK